METQRYLPGTHPRAHWMRMDAASLLKRFFFCEQALIIAQAGWLGRIADLAIKTTLPRFAWEDSRIADDLRERVFELRFPSRLMEVGEDAPLIALFAEGVHAPNAEAFILSLARVYKPALLQAYRSYLAQADEIADGPTLRALRIAIDDKAAQLVALERWAAEMLRAAPDRRPLAEAWAAALQERLAALDGVSLGPLAVAADVTPVPGRVPFALAARPARDPRFHRCRFYWPDIIDPAFPYGEGLRMQLRSAISHLNEVWAVEAAGAALYTFAETLGWEFVSDAARWLYDEARHVRMGAERLQQWGFAPAEIPLGTYIYEGAASGPSWSWLGMLSYFETKNIGKKVSRAQAFAAWGDAVSRHDMEFDWADETIHAHFGQRWLKALHAARPQEVPPPEAARAACDHLVARVVASAADDERAAIRRVAQAMIEKAEAITAAAAAA